MKMARVGCSPGIAESEAESEVVGLGRRESVRRESERDVRADIPTRKSENPLQFEGFYKLEGAPPRSISIAGNGVLFIRFVKYLSYRVLYYGTCLAHVWCV